MSGDAEPTPSTHGPGDDKKEKKRRRKAQRVVRPTNNTTDRQSTSGIQRK